VSGVRLRGSLVFLLCLVLSGGVFGAAASAQHATPEPELTIYGPDEVVGGATLGEWAMRSFQWQMSLPQEINPSFQPDGTGCSYGQSGPVFFIPGAFVQDPATQFTCVVPEGTAIFVMAGGAGCTTVEPPPFFGANESELRACVEEQLALVVGVEATVNGEPVSDLDRYQTVSQPFTLNFPEGNFLGVEPGVALSVALSYAFIVAPPPPGEYTIFVSITYSDLPEPLTSTATVIVEKPQVVAPEASPVASPVA
jgi:hypothetical protein